ncbi:hypothetical protein KFK09_004672 [Dendrobium nobile]|uniref:Phytosulfokine n=1 Tax=Dendrobium nobile TaxID=94219 RepID=A0A8T3C1B4_DENNO|nr:hypothetical protein KFK09_004672 [Dendrobium nobile]
MSTYKLNTFLFLAALLFLSTAQSTRPLSRATLESQEQANLDKACEEECLMRRTLIAHTDYIYTQEKHG